jgi:transcriptional regulator with XRE-family HTH domain
MDLERFGRIVYDRRDELGLTQEEVEENGGPTDTTLGKIENVEWTPGNRKITLRKLDVGLKWEPGSAKRTLNGGDPTPIPDDEPPPPPRRRQYLDRDAERALQEKRADDAQRLQEDSDLLTRVIELGRRDDLTPDEQKFVDGYHARLREGPIDSRVRAPEVVFDDWQRAKAEQRDLTLEYARKRGISYTSAERELDDVRDMAADVAAGTRPWTPPWDPGPEYGPDDRPWTREWWAPPEPAPGQAGQTQEGALPAEQGDDVRDPVDVALTGFDDALEDEDHGTGLGDGPATGRGSGAGT